MRLGPIDLVYLWCDLADPVWRKKKEDAARRYGLAVGEGSNAKYRFLSNDELRFSLRSAAKFVPWVRSVVIVIDDDSSLPQWLDISNPKLRIVHHSEFIPARYLPSFNSVAIEHFLARIPGLSERFLYANDDMMFARPLKPSFFFTRDGFPICRYTSGRIPEDSADSYHAMLLHASELVLGRHREAKGDLLRMAGFLPHHNVDSYIKHDMLDCFGKYEREITETMDFPFRTPGNVMRTIYQLEAAACGRARYRLARRGVWGGKWRWLLNPFRHGRPYADSLQFVRAKWRLGPDKIRKWHAGLFCFNDTDGITDDDRAWVRGVYERMFPEKSQFECGAGDVTTGRRKGKLQAALQRLASAIFRLFPIRKRRVLFQTFQGEYCCNPKYVTEALAGQDGVDIVWALDRNADTSGIPAGVKVVRKGSLRHCMVAATAKVWFENGLNLVRSRYVKKRRGQVYFQPLHGSLGLKRQGLAGPEIRAKADAITDWCISNSAFETEVYRTSYWPTTEILEYGHPRNDVFFWNADEKARISASVRETLGVASDVRLALYAPTFRPDGDISCLDLDPVMLKAALERRFGGEWTVLFRLHKRDMARHRAPSGSWVDASVVPDMQELMVACDVGITDYSSWICDYVLGDGFGFIYARDVEKYSANPGFYYPLESTPFPVARSNKELAAAIDAFAPEGYRERKNAFIRAKGCVDDGRASERCARKIREVLGT